MSISTYTLHLQPFVTVEVGVSLFHDGGESVPEDVSQSKDRVRFVFPCAVVEDSVEVTPRRIVIHRKYTFTRDVEARTVDSILLSMKDPDLTIPSVLYRGNDRGFGTFPRGGVPDGWSFMEDRTPLPNALLLSDHRSELWFCTSPAVTVEDLSSVGTTTTYGGTKIETHVPGWERPASYRGKTLLEASERRPPVRAFSVGETIHRTFFLFRREIHEPSDGCSMPGFREFVSSLSSRREFAPRLAASTVATWDEYRNRKLHHLLYLLREDGETRYHYLKMGDGNGEHQEVYEYTSASFLVKSVEGAWILARLSPAGEDEETTELLEKAVSVGRFFLAGESDPGVYRDNFDLRQHIWGGYLGISEHPDYRHYVNARCSGESMSAYLKLYEELKSRHIEIPEFLDLPKRVASFYLAGQTAEGSFGRWWRPDGTAVDASGTNGAYIASFLIALQPHLSEPEEYRRSIERAGIYYSKLVASGDFYGDTLDADSYDRESGTALLTMFLDLYEWNGKVKWLHYAESSAEWVLSWIWQYDVAFPGNSPLGRRKFRTTGMAGVSVAHHHLDFYGPAVAYEFLRLHEHKRNEFYRSQAIRMLAASKQLIADERDPLERSPEFYGWQPEQINHTRWDYFDRLDHGKGTFDICIAWPVVLGLSAYLRIRDRYPEAVDD